MHRFPWRSLMTTLLVVALPVGRVASAEDSPTSPDSAPKAAVAATPASPSAEPTPAAAPPAVIPAVAPLRTLPIDPPKNDGLIPDIKLGSGAKVKLYGFYKTSLIHDSSSPAGNDFPLPGFLGDTGPDGSPEFHIKARSFRFGSNFEWPDPSPKLTLTGRVEFDFEGDFTRVANRNISSIRSSQASIRLAWARLDRTLSDNATFFALFGQDWTPFGSSTLPNLVETTGLGLGFGTLYERAPQARFGFCFKGGGSLRIAPEVAAVLPFVGLTPSNVADQLAYGERQGVDSERPEFEGRLVIQFQLDHDAGVPPAQLIVSGMQSDRKVIVTAAAVPAAFKEAFKTGATLSSSRYGWTGEVQLPTRGLTLIGKYYQGENLRSFFAGQLFSVYTDKAGLTDTADAPSIDGASTVVFGKRGGVPVLAAQKPVRAKGGFVNVGFPLSRIFGAQPGSRGAGWQLYLHYGHDEANRDDVLKLSPLGNSRQRSDFIGGTLLWKINNYTTFAFEQSFFTTKAVDGAKELPLFKGVPSSEAKDNRQEFAVLFAF